jgi:DNA invertase Pin-like site-specific DNA recombinase
VLARLLKEIRPGETLVVVRLDRLARSVSHLLAVIEQLEGQGAHFRSLRDRPVHLVQTIMPRSVV